ncbi:MAG: HEAT repeat domain-containing protein [Sedimentisphaerales bacterium]|nr:HEAT repeat domain-containing protein [Sedimentisphaerales bacterium]
MIVKLMGSGFLKVIRMSAKRLYLIILILAIGCQQASIGKDAPVAGANGTTATKELAPQWKVNKEALDKGSIDAATVMLFHSDPTARKILLDTLKDIQNSSARIAVCKAFIKARLSKEEIKNKDDFIQPLLGVLSTEIPEESQLAAEAMLIFGYDKIGESLESITRDGSKPVNMRINAINALKLRPDMGATISLIRLVDDLNKQVSAEAEKALQSLGIPVGENYWIREQNIRDLQDKGKDEFVRAWLIRQETQLSNLRKEVKEWQDKYLSALDREYDGLSDEVTRGNFLKKHLAGSEARVKLLALDKVYKWQFASGKQKLPEELEPILLKLISDPDKDVRLKTAGLSVLGRMNSAQPLLAQLESESDDQVKIALLDALGEACSKALLVTPVKITPEVRKQALEMATKYLAEEDIEKARKGAVVLRKLLEPNGLKQEEFDGYLVLFVERYNQQKEKPDSALRGELLLAMASLCKQDGTVKQDSTGRIMAAKLFEPLFIEALSDKTDFVRETAVDGLINIDKAAALKRLRKYVDDSSEILRKKVIDVAGDVGGKEDLAWLVEKIGSNSESGPAWLAMLKIFDGSDLATLKEWMDKLTSQESKTKLPDDQKIAFLKKAEAKAAGDTKLLESIRNKLAELYDKTDQFERAAEYFDMLYKSAPTAKEKEIILPKILDAYLRGSKEGLAAEVVRECLAKGDLSSGNAVLKSIDDYLSKPTGADPNVVIKALSELKLSEARPNWQKWLKGWTDRLSKSEEAEKPKEATAPKKA